MSEPGRSLDDEAIAEEACALFPPLVAPPAQLAPRPRSLAETGIPRRVLEMLLIKHLSQVTELDKLALSSRLCLSGSLVEELLQGLKGEALLETRADGRFERSLRFGLTHKGMALAQYEWQRDGYLGPAPVSLTQYRALVMRQSARHDFVTAERFAAGMSDVLLTQAMINQLGPALNSGRAIFIYGHPGTGKTYVSRRLVRLFATGVLIPHALCIDEHVLPVFDPLVHRPLQLGQGASLRLDEGADPRWQWCQRPEVMVGGELTTDMLDVNYDASLHAYRAPLQLKANNGLFLIDDLGRQKVAVDAILNRWIVPMEERIDYLTLASGKHFEVPFEQVLVFSTNLPPHELVDEAFLRRIGYKIPFLPISPEHYRQLWQQQCQRHEVQWDEPLLQHLLKDLHQACSVPLLPCHPRDLVGLCRDQINFTQAPPRLTSELLDAVWRSYFVSTEEQGGKDHEG